MGFTKMRLDHQKARILQKEILRKSIHALSALVPLGLAIHRTLTMGALTAVLILYCIAEAARIKGRTVPLVSAITAACARSRDQHRFVLGPVTLSLGVLATAMLFSPIPARVGIFALAFGDGCASIAGILWGRTPHPFSRGKTVAGSLACFTAIFLTTFAVTRNATASLVTALVGRVVESFPLGDWDNVVLPLALAALIQFQDRLV
jgi:dolichol kinase